MNDLDVENVIRSHRDALEGEVCSRSRVVDALLDIRLDVGGRHDLTALVDEALVELPGKTMVPTQWFRERLDTLELAAVNPVEPVG